MKKYKVTIAETLEREVEVEAPDWNHALDIVEESYWNGDVVLTADDHKDTDFYAEEIPPESEKYSLICLCSSAPSSCPTKL